MQDEAIKEMDLTKHVPTHTLHWAFKQAESSDTNAQRLGTTHSAREGWRVRLLSSIHSNVQVPTQTALPLILPHAFHHKHNEKPGWAQGGWGHDFVISLVQPLVSMLQGQPWLMMMNDNLCLDAVRG